MKHSPAVGPALHIHPRGPESFVILEGRYIFFCDGIETTLQSGESICIPPNRPHRYVVGNEGGRLLVIAPPTLENYFWEVAQLLSKGKLPLADEFKIAASYGQDFLDSSSHWGHQ